MAKIAGKDVTTEISTDDGTTWTPLICEISSGDSMTRNTTTAPLTKCDVAANPRELTLLDYEVTYNFDALVDDAPATGQVTYGDMLTLFINGTKFKVRRQADGTGSDFYKVADAYLTSLSETSPVEGFVGFSGEIKASGVLDITA
jgi:hypothetical protein